MINAPHLRHASWKSRMDMLVEKLFPPVGVPGKLPEDYRPGRPSIFISRPQWGSNQRLHWEQNGGEKGVPTPSGRAHHRWCPWAGRKIGGAFQNQLHLLRVGWLAMESVHLTCPCCSEDVVLRYVSGYWLNLSPQNSGRNPRAPIAGTETC